MPIAELDRMLTNGAVRKELAVVVIGQWTGRVPTKEEAKMLEEFSSRIREGKPVDETVFWVGEGPTREGFASEMNEKLRKAGFKQVVFANKYNGMYTRMRIGGTPTEEKTPREKAFLKSSSTNSPSRAISQVSSPVCDSNHVAEMIKAINSRDESFYAKFDFGESDVLGWLFRCADVAFKSEDGEFIQLAHPEPLGVIPISELERILEKPGLRKELAVVFIEQFRPIDFGKGHYLKHPEARFDFVAGLDEKLRGVGFKQVIFAFKYNGLHHRMLVPTKHP
jgi:hypothetical protein